MLLCDKVSYSVSRFLCLLESHTPDTSFSVYISYTDYEWRGIREDETRERRIDSPAAAAPLDGGKFRVVPQGAPTGLGQ